MRQFILFIRRFFNLILFMGIEIVCLVLIARTKTLQGNDLTNSANAISGYFYNKQSELVYYFGLRKMNDSLLGENARLHDTLAKLHSFDSINNSIGRLPVDINDTGKNVRFAEYVYRTAHVINNSVVAANNYITISRGSDDGVQKNMAVMSGTGLVGKVEHVSRHYATILSLLSVKQQVSAKLKDGNFSFVTWEGERPDVLLMRGIPPELKVKKNDSVFTTGYSQYLPANILIGTVTKIEILKKDNSQQLYLRPATNFRNLQYVYLIEDKMLNERILLEDSATAVKLKK